MAGGPLNSQPPRPQTGRKERLETAGQQLHESQAARKLPQSTLYGVLWHFSLELCCDLHRALKPMGMIMVLKQAALTAPADLGSFLEKGVPGRVEQVEGRGWLEGRGGGWRWQRLKDKALSIKGLQLPASRHITQESKDKWLPWWPWVRVRGARLTQIPGEIPHQDKGPGMEQHEAGLGVWLTGSPDKWGVPRQAEHIVF